MPTLCFIIHGIGNQNQDFAEPLTAGVDQRLQKLIAVQKKNFPRDWTDVESTHLVSYHSLYWANIGTDAQANLYRTLYPELFAEQSRWKTLINAVAKYTPFRNLSVNLLGDVFGYLGQFQEQIKQSVFNQIRDALSKAYATREPVSIIVVGHSLGTVILHDLIGGFLRYRYADFNALVGHTSVFTMGSPLSLFTLVADGARPDNFRRWVNIIHERDLVAFPMQKLKNYRKVEDKPIRSGLSMNPLALHADYWANPEVHECIAQEIIAHRQQRIGLVPSMSAAGLVPPEIFQPLSGGMNIAGLAEGYIDFRDVKFKELIRSSREIDFCNIYGGLWLSTYHQDFARALERPELKLRACITADDSPALSALSHHFEDKPITELKQKIAEGTNALRSAAAEAKKKSKTPGRALVYHSRNMINHSFYRFDDLLYYTPRPLSSSKNAATPIPCFSFRRTGKPSGGHDWFMRDFEELLKTERDTKLVFDSTA
ncbi:MAG TPA: lipase family protein [Lacunisphaera sp.]|nr:lipase family protein [Lacunisphaera sp.]